MPAADQPATTAMRVILVAKAMMPMDMPVGFLFVSLYGIVMGDSGRHKHQRGNYSRDDPHSV